MKVSCDKILIGVDCIQLNIYSLMLLHISAIALVYCIPSREIDKTDTSTCTECSRSATNVRRLEKNQDSFVRVIDNWQHWKLFGNFTHSLFFVSHYVNLKKVFIKVTWPMSFWGFDIGSRCVWMLRFEAGFLGTLTSGGLNHIMHNFCNIFCNIMMVWNYIKRYSQLPYYTWPPVSRTEITNMQNATSSAVFHHNCAEKQKRAVKCDILPSEKYHCVKS